MNDIELKNKFFIFDGNNLTYRAFYAINSLSTSKGEPTNAIFGFTRILLKLLKEHMPNYLVVCFDFPGPSFRVYQYKEYKSHRAKMPQELICQLPLLKKVIKAFSIPIFEYEGFEADDLIATLVKKIQIQNPEIKIILVTGDKDICQLVSSNVYVMMPQKGLSEFTLLDISKVQEKFGVLPKKIPDFLGLKGDPSDNIPGIPGIGEKIAKQLLTQFDSLEDVLKNIEKIEDSKIKEKVTNYNQQAILSKELVKLKEDVPLKFSLEESQRKKYNKDYLFELFKQLEFVSLFKEIKESSQNNQKKEYKIINSSFQFRKLLSNLEKNSCFAFKIITSKNLQEILGLSIALDENTSFYLPKKILEENFASLKSILQNEQIKKYGYNLKEETIYLQQKGIELKGIEFDVLIAAYLLNPTRTNYGLKEISINYLPKEDITFEFFEKENIKILEIENIANYNNEIVELIFRLKLILESKIKEENLEYIFYQIELPLISVLSAMELRGIKLDFDFLSDFSKELDLILYNLEKKIFNLTKEKFNLNSSKQLSFILFEKLKLDKIKKTKTGFSTDTEVLQILSTKHSLPLLILNYRELSKLKNTYVDTLPKLINPYTQRIHTSFNQTGTVTGRLSSSNPNLQNIPIKKEIGRRIRKAFITEKGYALMCADYSQIELRILASLSEDSNLIEAFIKDEDIHTFTATLIFNKEKKDISSELRRIAKTVNFGIIYGMSPYGLSRELETSVEKAKKFIEDYFERYKGVKKYIEEVIQSVQEKKYVTTLLGRKRYLTEIDSSKTQIQELAKRNAINSPIQGTAADIIKLAMICIEKELKQFSSKLILQVHDELILEVLNSELEKVKEIVKYHMENVVKLKVPLKVEITTEENWYNAHKER